MSLQSTFPADRLMLAVLQAGVASLVADATLFARLLAAWPAAERATWRTRFLARPPKVRGGYARVDDPWPTWSVVLADESAEQELCGQFLELDTTVAPSGLRQLGSVESQKVDIQILTEHPEETRIHHLLCKSLVRESILWLCQNGAQSVGYEGARDLHPEALYLPESLYPRLQTWSINGLTVTYEARPVQLLKIYAFLEGITVSGHPGEMTPVQNLTP